MDRASPVALDRLIENRCSRENGVSLRFGTNQSAAVGFVRAGGKCQWGRQWCPFRVLVAGVTAGSMAGPIRGGRWKAVEGGWVRGL